MEQVVRNASMQDSGYLNGCRYLLHDRDQKFCREFRETLAAGGVQCLPLPARSPNLNAYAERWVRSIKEECLASVASEADPVRGEVVAACGVELSGTLSPGTQSPRQGQCVAVSGPCGGDKFARRDPLSGAARRLTQILQPRRMTIFTIQEATCERDRPSGGASGELIWGFGSESKPLNRGRGRAWS